MSKRPPASLTQQLADMPVMSDAPVPLPADFKPVPATTLGGEAPPATFKTMDPDPKTGKIATLERPSHLDPATLPVGTEVQYEPRVSIVTAYRFNGQVAKAPDYIDRNWISYNDGPTLTVMDGDVEIGLCKVGDWICRQDVTIDDASEPEGKRVVKGKLAVISSDEFDRLYRAYIVPGK